MSPNPFSSLPITDAPPDEEDFVDGLERALAQARTKIPDHDSPANLGFPSKHEAVAALKPEVAAPVPFDSRAVMDVLREAIDRYTHGDGHKQGAWVEELAQAKDNSPVIGNSRLAAGYAPDRRLLAAVVVVLFLLFGGIGYTQFGLGGNSENVKTNTPVTVHGQPVTTMGRPSTSAAPTTLPSTTDTSAPAPATAASATSTTVRRSTTTTAPPETTTTAPPETTTTAAPTTTTAAPTTTTASGPPVTTP